MEIINTDLVNAIIKALAHTEEWKQFVKIVKNEKIFNAQDVDRVWFDAKDDLLFRIKNLIANKEKANEILERLRLYVYDESTENIETAAGLKIFHDLMTE